MKLYNKPNKSTQSYGDKGDIIWRNNAGNYHRIGGPAIENVNGTVEYWQNGKRHRLDGPAYECSDGYKEWHVSGKQISEEQHKLLYSIMKLKDLL